jgi:hypothetical protein
VCFVWIWKQTAIIFLYSITWLVLITETECVYCAVRTASLNIVKLILIFQAAPWIRGSVACLSPLRPGFDPRPVNVSVVMEKVALGQGFLRTLCFSLISIFPLVLRTHLQLHVAPTKTNGRSLGTFNKQRFFRNQEAKERKVFNPCQSNFCAYRILSSSY